MNPKPFLLLLTAGVSLLLFACNKEYPPVFYQQVYSLDGVRTESDQQFQVGTPVPVKDFKTNLQLLYAAYPEQVKPYIRPGIYRQGAFFEQHGYLRNMGDGVGDMCDHAAWLVLNVFPAKQRAARAAEIAKAMFDANEAEILNMLNRYCKEAPQDGSIQAQYSYYDEDNCELVKRRREVYVGNDFKKNGRRLGLTRTYYESGMVASDTYYLYDVPVGYSFTYLPTGGIDTVRYYHPDGRITIVWQRVHSDR